MSAVLSLSEACMVPGLRDDAPYTPEKVLMSLYA